MQRIACVIYVFGTFQIPIWKESGLRDNKINSYIQNGNMNKYIQISDFHTGSDTSLRGHYRRRERFFPSPNREKYWRSFPFAPCPACLWFPPRGTKTINKKLPTLTVKHQRDTCPSGLQQCPWRGSQGHHLRQSPVGRLHEVTKDAASPWTSPPGRIHRIRSCRCPARITTLSAQNETWNPDVRRVR